MQIDDIPIYVPEKSVKFIDQLRTFIRYRNLVYTTEKTYVHWAKRYIHYHQLKHPADLDSRAIENFLTYLSVKQAVSINTQKIALNAIIFMYREFMRKPVECLNYSYAKPPKRVPNLQCFQIFN
jgi:hypothetical protein